MTERKSFKRRVRDRMSKTGESYTAARTQVTKKRDRNRAATERLAAASDFPSDEAVRENTGKSWKEWFAVLDAWGAREKKHPEIARHLNQELGVPGWWAQSVTVAYERARGMRVKHQQPDGTFAVPASKTINVPIDRAFAAFVDAAQRRRWLTDETMRMRTSQQNRSARFDWGNGASRVVVGFEEKGPSKSLVALQHERLADADDAETEKAAWRRRLADLKSFLES